MRLSEAILLGDSLKKPNGVSYDVIDGCGCALAGARLASGLGSKWSDPIPQNDPRFLAMWPWFTPDHEHEISRMYFQVCDKKLTIEQLADEVCKWEDELGVYDNLQSLLAHDQGTEPTQNESRTPELLQVRR